MRKHYIGHTMRNSGSNDKIHSSPPFIIIIVIVIILVSSLFFFNICDVAFLYLRFWWVRYHRSSRCMCICICLLTFFPCFLILIILLLLQSYPLVPSTTFRGADIYVLYIPFSFLKKIFIYLICFFFPLYIYIY